eukprot:CAMPEP_0172445470 /NCGR_PEP_ID=MMETSP1065-20121228/5296_1 /TAXON_ID=265537 /ORGANISM="Amphiprora paludosa, Strain CCMP125" /LENGTH=201 /DNA_ID=CAMNT_0013196333 /DNA_START=132 /DNA_END=737 /DNA_ORIENTATION=+
MKWYTNNLTELEYLNPGMPFLFRTTQNAMPAVTTELDWTMQDTCRFMIQSGRFRDENGTISEARIEAAKAFLATDLPAMRNARFAYRGFDPESPVLDEENPNWKEDPNIVKAVEPYLAMKSAMEEQMAIFQSGPNAEWHQAERAIVMCQRIDLWCAGPDEVERAVVHLYKLGRALNDLEAELPPFILDYYPGQDDFLNRST